MEVNKLFIPARLRVGFVKREDTFTKRLSYVTYYDTKGVLRKQVSWENWRDKSIEPIELDNTPHSGFILNKDVQRFNWYHYSTGRSMIRVYDDRGIEFEITPANLLFILMNTNCYKRELEGEFVYAWDNKELVLLPTCCEEYKASTGFTELQRGKVTVKDMVPGCTYKNKEDVDWVYMGRFPWFSYSEKRGYFTENRYVFIRADVITKPLDSAYVRHTLNLQGFSERVTDFPVDCYADRLGELSKTKHLSQPVGLVTQPLTLECLQGKSYYRMLGVERASGVFDMFYLHWDTRWNSKTKGYEYDGEGYLVDHTTTLTFSGGKLSKTDNLYYSPYQSGFYLYSIKEGRSIFRSLQEIIDKYVDVKVELANGLRVNYYEF